MQIQKLTHAPSLAHWGLPGSLVSPVTPHPAIPRAAGAEVEAANGAEEVALVP